MKTPVRLLAAAAALAACGGAHAQDTRTVREPTLPPACAVLVADTASAGMNDAARIQSAIDKCPAGRAVYLSPFNEKTAFVSGPLTLKSGVTLVVDAGATLYASTNPALFDRGNNTCGTNDQSGRGCRPFIYAEDTRGSGIMGEGVIDGQGGHRIDGKSESWWQIARRAQKEKTRQNVPRLIEVSKSQDFTMYRITLRNSPNFHAAISRVDGFTAWGVRIDTPHDARNTDGIDPISSRNVTIAHSYIRTGDDNVAIKGGNSGPSENISILHNHFYSGHGMSIGSETNSGVRNVLVEDLSMDGTTSGLRIKSSDTRGGEVKDIVYRDVCLNNVKKPIEIDTHYEQQATPGNLVPQFSDVTFERVHSLTPGLVQFQGYDQERPLRATLRDVVIEGKPTVRVEFARLTNGDGQPAQINRPGVKPLNCDGRFAAFPQEQAPNKRPQLTAQQAKAYEYREVLKYTGPVGNERIDPWDPLADPLAKGEKFKPDYIVDLNAEADNRTTFNSVQATVSEAVSNARAGRRVYIQVKPGVYNELVYVPAAAVPITLYSDAADAAATRITANLQASVTSAAYVQQFGPQFAHAAPSIQAMYDEVKAKPQVTTHGSQIVWVRNHGFQARNITFENAFNKDRGNASGECVAANCPEQSVEAQLNRVRSQAVALRVDGADKAQFENVRLLGFQDTLYINNADEDQTVRSFFNKSYVEGDVDFIFGDSIAYFNECEVKTLSERGSSYAAAPDTSRRARYGFVFNRCRFTNDGAPNAKVGKFYLARQWFHNSRCTPYGAMPVEGYSCKIGDADSAPDGTIRKRTLERVGKMVVMNSTIGSHINKTNPWADWNKNGTIAHRRVQLSSDDYWTNLAKAGLDPATSLGDGPRPSPADIYLGEYNNTIE
ncbi:pectinesterase family protein [Massilia horti]|uniref:Pectin lyase fold-containing protein n=1 Tax=Massilia horti TaxID=2562153 RepID=A0A4Y9SKG6_9BURK|nr:pectinesterase family protein [Massilia horti]TFW27140.1 pectin lyase fold-containing protein [Massilia horti]